MNATGCGADSPGLTQDSAYCVLTGVNVNGLTQRCIELEMAQHGC